MGIDVFYQGEDLREIEHIEVEPTDTFGVLKAALRKKHALAEEVLIFIEDSDEPVLDTVIVAERGGRSGVKAHVHRCHCVEVEVRFNNETVRHGFGPGATVARVKYWAAVDKFKMTPEEASEHVLQIQGTQDRPSPGTHLGALTSCPKCNVAFDLVPDHRVNGASSEAL